MHTLIKGLQLTTNLNIKRFYQNFKIQGTKSKFPKLFKGACNLQFSLIENNNPTTFTKKKKKKEDTYSWCVDGYFTRQFHETTIQHMGPTHVLKDWSFEIF